MIKYRIRPGIWPGTTIEMVEVEKETEASVWIHGQRIAKVAAYAEYHTTWADARASLLECVQVTLDNSRSALMRAQGLYGNIKGMKEPA